LQFLCGLALRSVWILVQEKKVLTILIILKILKKVCLGYVTIEEEMQDVCKQLKLLDDFVYNNHFRSRACALEELLLSPIIPTVGMFSMQALLH